MKNCAEVIIVKNQDHPMEQLKFTNLQNRKEWIILALEWIILA